MNRTGTRALLLMCMTVLLCGQTDDQQPYFSLSSSRTFGSGEKITVELNAVDVDALDFRVYRINDPVRFFTQLENTHQFGGTPPRPEHELTPIERFHHWKVELHSNLRFVVRKQFSTEAWDGVRDLRHPAASKPDNVTNFTSAPVLNPQQLVATWRQRVKALDRWRSQTVPVPVKENGVYLVEAAREDLQAYTIVMVTDLAVVTKMSSQKMVAFVVDRKSGEPASGVPVSVGGGVKQTLQASTDRNGLAFFPPVAGSNQKEPMLFAKTASSFAVSSLSSYSATEGDHAEYTGYAYTDRPVYRPGHPVHFKCILRMHQGNLYKLPDLPSAEVEVHSADDKTIYKKTLPVSSTGTVSGDLTLPANSSLGNYSVQVNSGSAMVQANFEVQEYKKPEYDVRVTLAKARVLQGESITATVDARYFFGEPVAGAKVQYVVYRSRYWFPMYGFEDQNDDPDEEDARSNDGGEQISDEEAKLNADGKFTFSIPTTVDTDRYDASYRVEARVTDAGNREITGQNSGLATYGSYWVNVSAEQYVMTPGTAGTFKVVALDYDNKPVAAKVEVDLIPPFSRNNRNGVEDPAPVAHLEVQTGENGEVRATLTPPKAGSYRVRVRSRTPENKVVQNYGYIWVTGDFGNSFGEASKRIQIITDKKSYKPGDHAKVLIVTSVPGAKVLFSREGTTLGEVRVLSVSGSSVTIDIPIDKSCEPNFFVSAAFLRDGALYEGTKAIRVPADEQKLSLELTGSKPQFQPGETAQYTLIAHDATGKPVAGEFSLGMVDEAIYGIRKDATPDIHRAFYGPTYNRVGTANSLSYYFNGEAGKRRMQLAEMHHRSTLAQLKPDRFVRPKVRKLFPDTAFWLANLKTDGSGRGTATVTFPDSITTWRATVRGATADTKVGSVVQKTVVRKNVILRLVSPRFFTQGDEVTISAVVHNYLSDAKQARVSLDIKGLEGMDLTPRDVTIPSRGEVKVDWRVRAGAIGNAVLTATALTNEESDAMEITLPVEPQGVRQAVSQGGSLTTGRLRTSVKLDFPAQAVAATRNIEIQVSPSIAGALFGAVNYLTAFPYGCTEQTLSSFVPNVVVSKALSELGIHSDVNQKVLDEKIHAGLDRLYDFQHEDGGWGWWKTDASSLFMTTAAVSGLAQAKTAGVDVKPEAIANGVKWLRANYGTEPNMLADQKAYLAWALTVAGANDPKILDDVRQVKGKLTPYGEALLGLALENVQDKSGASAMAARLEGEVKTNPTEAWWPGDRDTLMDFYTDVGPEVTAFALKLLVHERPQSPLLAKTALWLMNHRLEGSYWYSTKQTAMVIYGLTDFVKLTGELKPDLTATVMLNGSAVLTKKFQPADALSTETNKLIIPATASTNEVSVSMTGQGRLYWSTRANYYSTERKLVKAGSLGLNLLRDYFRLTPSTQSGVIRYNLTPLSGNLAVGDVLAVRITVTGSAWKYLLVEDPIPAGAEFIEKDQDYELTTRPDWWSGFFSRREFHDDHAAMFDTFFQAGQRQYVYLLKIVNPGQFRVSPATVQPMYQPQFLATTENQVVTVK